MPKWDLKKRKRKEKKKERERLQDRKILKQTQFFKVYWQIFIKKKFQKILSSKYKTLVT